MQYEKENKVEKKNQMLLLFCMCVDETDGIVSRCEANRGEAEGNCTAMRLRREGAVAIHSSQREHHIAETFFMY